MVFKNLKKAYDRDSKKKKYVWRVLKKKGIPMVYVQKINDKV